MHASLLTGLCCLAILVVVVTATGTPSSSHQTTNKQHQKAVHKHYQEEPTAKVDCSFGDLDFSSLAAEDIFISHHPMYDVWLHVCGVLSSDCDGDSNAAVCSTDRFHRSDVLGDVPLDGKYNWTLIDESQPNFGVAYQLVGGQCQGSQLITTNINFVCSPTAGDATSVAGECQTNVTIPTSLACSSKQRHHHHEEVRGTPIHELNELF